MKKFLVKHDFRKCQPHWNKSYSNTFGENNEGFIVEGETAKQAVEVWNEKQLAGNRLNPFYLDIKEIVLNE